MTTRARALQIALLLELAGPGPGPGQPPARAVVFRLDGNERLLMNALAVLHGLPPVPPPPLGAAPLPDGAWEGFQSSNPLLRTLADVINKHFSS